MTRTRKIRLVVASIIMLLIVSSDSYYVHSDHLAFDIIANLLIFCALAWFPATVLVPAKEKR